MDNDLKSLKQEFITLSKGVIYRQGIDELLEQLENSDFYTAPASTKYHDSCEGGLVQHSLKVYNHLKTEVGLHKLTITDESIAICALFHDLCKVGFYISEIKNRKVYKPNGSKIDSMGRYDWESYYGYTVEDKFPMGHGEKSLYMLRDFMNLTADEALAIRWHMGGFEPKENHIYLSKTYETNKLAVLLNIADMKASYIE